MRSSLLRVPYYRKKYLNKDENELSNTFCMLIDHLRFAAGSIHDTAQEHDYILHSYHPFRLQVQQGSKGRCACAVKAWRLNDELEEDPIPVSAVL